MVLEILLVEDDEAQVWLVREALKRWKTPYHLQVANTAEEAVRFLGKTEDVSDTPRPHLALIDINLPKEPGFEVLKAIKERPDLRSVVVMMLSSSSSELDVQEAVRMHANAYFQKPNDYEEIEQLFEAFEMFWRKDVRFALPAN